MMSDDVTTIDAVALVISASAFEELALGFAASDASRSPSWAWVPATDDGPLAPPVGFLRSASIPVPPPPAAGGLPSDEALLDESLVDDDNAAAQPLPVQRLELHIVFSETYQVPVLLLQGYGEDGQPWRPDAVRAHLGRCATAGTEGLPLDMVSQMEHPVLRVPFCCLHPCRTADLMARLLSGDGAKLDYLSAWWSVVAPHVGVQSRAACFCGAASMSRCDAG